MEVEGSPCPQPASQISFLRNVCREAQRGVSERREKFIELRVRLLPYPWQSFVLYLRQTYWMMTGNLCSLIWSSMNRKIEFAAAVDCRVKGVGVGEIKELHCRVGMPDERSTIKTNRLSPRTETPSICRLFWWRMSMSILIIVQRNGLGAAMFFKSSEGHFGLWKSCKLTRSELHKRLLELKLFPWQSTAPLALRASHPNRSHHKTDSPHGELQSDASFSWKITSTANNFHSSYIAKLARCATRRRV